MIHRPEHYVELLLLAGASQEPRSPGYAEVVRHFSNGGRPMVSPRFRRIAEEQDDASRQ
jgi:hypothetical protein